MARSQKPSPTPKPRRSQGKLGSALVSTPIRGDEAAQTPSTAVRDLETGKLLGYLYGVTPEEFVEREREMVRRLCNQDGKL